MACYAQVKPGMVPYSSEELKNMKSVNDLDPEHQVRSLLIIMVSLIFFDL
jgi:hypothetical protein